MDRLTPGRRSWNMGRIRGKDTSPERRVRSLLHRQGFRFSLHRKDLAGKPDIVLPRFHTALFVHGCFWHHHPKCSNGVLPKSRPEFWANKLLGNVERDRNNARKLRKLGWNVIVVWECELDNETELLKKLCQSLNNAKKD